MCVCVCVCVYYGKRKKNCKNREKWKEKGTEKKEEKVCVCVCVFVCLLKKLGSKKWERIEDRKNSVWNRQTNRQRQRKRQSEMKATAACKFTHIVLIHLILTWRAAYLKCPGSVCAKKKFRYFQKKKKWCTRTSLNRNGKPCPQTLYQCRVWVLLPLLSHTHTHILSLSLSLSWILFPSNVRTVAFVSDCCSGSQDTSTSEVATANVGSRVSITATVTGCELTKLPRREDDRGWATEYFFVWFLWSQGVRWWWWCLCLCLCLCLCFVCFACLFALFALFVFSCFFFSVCALPSAIFFHVSFWPRD